MAVTLRRRVVDIDTPAEFAALADSGRRSADGWRVRRLDLTGETAAVLALRPAGSLFLGCTLEPSAVEHLVAGGALVFPEVPDVPVDPYRSTLYTPAELYAGVLSDGYAATPDARAYAWSQRPTTGTAEIVARALHDAAVESALDEALAAAQRPVVGVMGGHGVQRGSDGYRQAARLGAALTTAGRIVATGGGPGAMEAANLGALAAAGEGGRPSAALDDALEALATAPSFRPSVDGWLSSALDVAAGLRGASVTQLGADVRAGGLGVPTWFYGHEPSNVFAGAIAKFFQNSVREATLLNRCTGGVVFLPGAAGTVQEVFQDACENYYAPPGQEAPMILVDREHWTEHLPVWPLLTALAERRPFRAAVHLVEDVDAAIDVVTAARPASPPLPSLPSA